MQYFYITNDYTKIRTTFINIAKENFLFAIHDGE